MNPFSIKHKAITNICKKIKISEIDYIQSILNLSIRTPYIVELMCLLKNPKKSHQIDLGILEATIHLEFLNSQF